MLRKIYSKIIKESFHEIGENVEISKSAVFLSRKDISIGDNVYI